MSRSRFRSVIIFEDGGSQEFFFTKDKKLVLLSDTGPTEPEQLTFKDAFKRLEQYRPNYPPNCQLYTVAWEDFEQRRAIVRAEAQAAREDRAARRAWLNSLPDPDPSQ